MKYLLLFSLLWSAGWASAQNPEPYFDSVQNAYGFQTCIRTEPLYSEVKSCSNGFYWVRSNEKWGLLSNEGKLVVNTGFDWSLLNQPTGFLLFFKSDTMYVWDFGILSFRDTLHLVNGVYDLLLDDGDSYISGYALFQVWDKGKMALASLSSGINFSLGTEYLKNITAQCKKTADIYISGNKGVFNFCGADGKKLYAGIGFGDFFGVRGNVAAIQREGKVEFIDLCSGKISGKSDQFKEDIYMNISGNLGVLDGSGKILLPFIYSSVAKYANGFYLVYRDGKFEGIVDAGGHQYLAEEDREYNWSFVFCDHFDFFMDAHHAYKQDSGDAVYFFNPATRKLERKTGFEFFSVECNKDKNGKYGISKGDPFDSTDGWIDSTGQIEWE